MSSYDNSVGAGSGLGAFTPSTFKPQNVDDGSNELTQSMQSVQNQMGTAGTAAIKGGSNVQASGLNTTQDATGDLHSLLGHFNRLIYGDRATAMGDTGGAVDDIANQFGQARQMFAQTGTRSGGNTADLADQQAQQTKATDDVLAKARASAEQSAPGVISTLANTGLATSEQGIQEQGLGMNSLQGLAGNLLGKNQVDVAESGQNKAMATAIIQALL